MSKLDKSLFKQTWWAKGICESLGFCGEGNSWLEKCDGECELLLQINEIVDQCSRDAIKKYDEEIFSEAQLSGMSLEAMENIFYDIINHRKKALNKIVYGEAEKVSRECVKPYFANKRLSLEYPKLQIR